MKLKALLHKTGIECPTKWEEIEITGINYDSRKISNGNIFVCLTGENTDGHIYAMDAMLRGASVIIAEKDLELPSIPVFGSIIRQNTLLAFVLACTCLIDFST
jgi:UDP-N-acetylmuramoyl-L-alanyl-D-glutamate--2,6-diaminopimelate ligase